MQFKADALCLRATNYRDKDKLLTLISAEKGKFTSLARGVRGANAKLKLAASPLCFGEYIIISKGNILAGCQVYDNFFNIWEDVDKSKAAFAILEVLEKICPEEQPASSELVRALNALNRICYQSTYPNAYLAWFLSGMLSILGINCGEYNINTKMTHLITKLGSIEVEAVESLEVDIAAIDKALRLLLRIIAHFTTLSFPLLYAAIGK